MYAKQYLDRINANKNLDGEDYLLEKTKGNFKGAAIGAGIGLVIAFSKGYNLLFAAVLGGAAGALISNAYLKYKNNEQ